jgi:Cu/Ag efflux pump CusA
MDTAIEEAGETHFIPIFLTTMTAISGMIPLIMEHSPLYSALTLGIVGGLISSLILTRIVTPVVYKLLPTSVCFFRKSVRSKKIDFIDLYFYFFWENRIYYPTHRNN